MLRRLPIDSSQPVVVFAVARLGLSLAALVATVALQYDDWGPTAIVTGAGFVPWSIAVLVVAQRDPDAALSPIVVAGDLALLVGLELATPDASRGVRAAALVLIAAHSQFQGEGRGMILAAVWVAVLVSASAIRGGSTLDSHLLAFYDILFAAAALATGLVVGRLRTSESASRIRARELSRHTLRSESEARRRVAEAIHDGPVQELIGLDMILATAGQEMERGGTRRAEELISDARKLTERNIQVLRDEMLDLGPYGIKELTLDTAIEECIPTWTRRYGFDIRVALETVPLPPEVSGELFRIAQEAVINAGRHANADRVSVSLRRVEEEVELRVADDGKGFGSSNPWADTEPGHLGLASMRERAELLGGRLEIDTSGPGTTVVARAPLDHQGPERVAWPRLRSSRRRMKEE